MTEKLGPLDVLRVTVHPEIARHSDESLTVVLCHGFGAPGDDLVALAAMGAPPGTELVFPFAPMALAEHVFGAGDARAWWLIDVARWERAARAGDIASATRDVPDGLAEAREKLVAMLDALDPRRDKRLVLGGFSQGAMLALDVALRDARPIEGVVMLSGTMIAAREWQALMPARKGLRVFQSHGRGDNVLPFSIADGLRHALEDAGLVVDFVEFDGGHGIPPEVARDLGAWVTRVARGSGS